MTATGGAPQMRRWNEQRWLLDSVVQAVGADWDSPRLAHLNAALGPEFDGRYQYRAPTREEIRRH